MLDLSQMNSQEVDEYVTKVLELGVYDDDHLKLLSREGEKVSKTIAKAILEQRSKDKRKHEIFSRGQAQLLVLFTGTLAFCSAGVFLIEFFRLVMSQ